jgi:hypothetical protein
MGGRSERGRVGVGGEQCIKLRGVGGLDAEQPGGIGVLAFTDSGASAAAVLAATTSPDTGA